MLNLIMQQPTYRHAIVLIREFHSDMQATCRFLRKLQGHVSSVLKVSTNE